MNPEKAIAFGVRLMIAFNLLVSFGAVWSLHRISPEITRIYQRNVISLDACEGMLLALSGGGIESARFRSALQLADGNITEKGEKETLKKIHRLLPRAEAKVPGARDMLVREIVRLTACNKQAIVDSARKAQRFRHAGAWGIVFLTVIFFVLALFFEQRLRRSLLAPLREISEVMNSFQQGDHFRRCSMPAASQEMKKLFRSFNDLLDRVCRTSAP